MKLKVGTNEAVTERSRRDLQRYFTSIRHFSWHLIPRALREWLGGEGGAGTPKMQPVPGRSRDAAAEPGARRPLPFRGLYTGERTEEGIKHSCRGLDQSTGCSMGERSGFLESFFAVSSHP